MTHMQTVFLSPAEGGAAAEAPKRMGVDGGAQNFCGGVPAWPHCCNAPGSPPGRGLFFSRVPHHWHPKATPIFEKFGNDHGKLEATILQPVLRNIVLSPL